MIHSGGESPELKGPVVMNLSFSRGAVGVDETAGGVWCLQVTRW